MTERQERAVDWQQGEPGSYGGTNIIELDAQHIAFLNREDSPRIFTPASEMVPIQIEEGYSRYTVPVSQRYSYERDERFFLREPLFGTGRAEAITLATSSEGFPYAVRAKPSGRPTESLTGIDSGSVRSAGSPELQPTRSHTPVDLMSVHPSWSAPRAMQHSSALADPYHSLDIFLRHREPAPLVYSNTSPVQQTISSNFAALEQNSPNISMTMPPEDNTYYFDEHARDSDMDNPSTPIDSISLGEIPPDDLLIPQPTTTGNNSNRIGLSRGTPNPSRHSRDSPVNYHEGHYTIDRSTVDRSEQPAIVREHQRRNQQIPSSAIGEHTPLLKQGSSSTSTTYKVLLSESSSFHNQGQHLNNLAPKDTSSSPSTGGSSSNADNPTATGGSNPVLNDSSSQSDGSQPPAQGTDNAVNQTAARPPPQNAAAVLVGFLKADPAIMTAFQFLLLTGMVFQAWSLFEFFNRKPIKGQGHFRDPDYLKLLAGFSIQLAFLFVLASDLQKHEEPFVRPWIIVVATLCLLSSGSGLIAYFWYTALGDALMWLGTLFQVWIWKMTVFRRREDGDGFNGLSAPSTGSSGGSSFPLTHRRPVSTSTLGA